MFKMLVNNQLLQVILLLAVNSQIAYSQTNWEQLFNDDFENGIKDEWRFQLIASDATWEITTINENNILWGRNHNWAELYCFKNWTDYQFSSDIKLIAGGIHINFRSNDYARYYLAFSSNKLELHKNPPLGDNIIIFEKDIQYDITLWHNFKIVAEASLIKIFVNNELITELNDQEPILDGTIAFETGPNSEVYLDNVNIYGKPLPSKPEGYIWKKTGGPSGGLGYDIRIHPTNKNILFVTDNPSGVNKSFDSGKTWSQRNTGIDKGTDGNVPIFSLTIDPNNPDIVWCGTQNANGIFKSTDGGESWIRKNNGITEEDNEISFRGFAINPTNSDMVLAAAEILTNETGIELMKSKGKIYKTTNGGENWYPVWEGNSLARVLIFNYQDPSILYCSTGIFDVEAYNSNPEQNFLGGVGILKSIDGGENWFTINNGLNNLFVGFLEMHPEDPDILYAAAYNVIANDSAGVYKTTDGGNTWHYILENHPPVIGCSVVTMSKKNPDIVYAASQGAVYRSEDEGKTWKEFFRSAEEAGAWGPPGVSAGFPIGIAVDPDNPYKVYVNNYAGGNFLSYDGGETWHNSSKGYSGANIYVVSVDPNDARKVFAGGKSGPFITYDGGTNWSGIQYGAADIQYSSISIFPDNTSEIIGSNDSNGSIQKSKNNGNTWYHVFQHPMLIDGSNGFHGFTCISISKSNSDIVYAGLRRSAAATNNVPAYDASYGMYKSVDRGETWTEINTGLDNTSKAINAIAIHPDNSDIVYIGTIRDGIYYTENGGSSWNPKNIGLVSSDIRSIAINYRNPKILYCGSGDGAGIFKSVDGGDLWMDINNGIILECPSYLNIIGRAQLGMDLKSMPKIFPRSYSEIPWTSVLDIEIDPVNPDKVYFADRFSGIYLSTNAGDNWFKINEGLSVTATNSLALSSDGQILYAGTQGNGVVRMVLETSSHPTIISTVPNIMDTITINLGDSIRFEVLAHDFNNDTLHYHWYLNDYMIDTGTIPYYLLETNVLSEEFHSLKVEISDLDTSIQVVWTIRLISPTDIKTPDDDSPAGFRLSQNFPNPFNGSTTIDYHIPSPTHVRISVKNIIGQEVKNLVNEYQSQQAYSIIWDGSNQNNAKLAGGIYILRMECIDKNNNKIIQEKKMILIR